MGGGVGWGGGGGGQSCAEQRTSQRTFCVATVQHVSVTYVSLASWAKEQLSCLLTLIEFKLHLLCSNLSH